MNKTMKIKMQDNLSDYLTIFKSFGNCGLDGNSYFYPFTTTSESRLKLYMGSYYIELSSYRSGNAISRCDYQVLLKKFKP